jgi:hypothetical protein
MHGIGFSDFAQQGRAVGQEPEGNSQLAPEVRSRNRRQRHDRGTIERLLPVRWPSPLCVLLPEQGSSNVVESNSSDSARIWKGNPPSVAYPDGDAGCGQQVL